MKVYQLLQQGSGKHVFLMIPADWKAVPTRGLPGFLEVLDSSGRHVGTLREFDIQELPAMQAKALGATNRP